MRRLRIASLVVALVAAPAGCVVSTACQEAGGVCLETDEVVRVQVGFDPDAIRVLDVDGDGRYELVGASSAAGTVTVVWSLGWSEVGATTWSIDQEVAGLVVADLDGDGRLDVATALPRADAVAVLRGRGGRSFAGPERYAAGAVPRALVAADLDGAGPPELVTGNLGDGTVTVLRSFVADPPVVVGPGPRALAAGDVDSDGHVDVAVALADADAVQILRNDGAGGLWPDAVHAVGAAPIAVVAADLDADGEVDIATADSLDDTVSVLWGDGAGGLDARQVWPTLPLPSALVVVEPVGEEPVLGVLSEATSSVAQLDPRTGAAIAGVLPGDPRALTFGGHALVAGGSAVHHMSSGIGAVLTELWQRGRVHAAWPVDLDQDGVDELFMLDDESEPGELTLRRGEESQVALPVGIEYPDSLRAGEFTGDGRVDVLVRASGSLVALVQQPDGSLQAGDVHEFPGTRAVDLADADGDGVAEILLLTATDTGSALTTLRSDGAGTFAAIDSLALELEDPATLMRVIDGDGDATPDLLLDGRYYLEDMQGLPRALAVGDRCLYIDALGDLDGDARLDAVCCFLGMSVIHDVLSPDPGAPIELFDSGCSGVELLDLDRDGDLELLAVEYVSDFDEPAVRFTPWGEVGGDWVAFGARLFESSSRYSAAHTLAELDGDGTPELVLRDSERTVAARVELGPALLADEMMRLAARPDLRFGDVDGDGAADLIALGNTLAIARADGEGGFGPLSHFWDTGKPGNPRVLSDVHLLQADDDGRPRVAWTSRASGSRVGELSVAALGLDGLHEKMRLGLIFAARAHVFPADVDRDGVRDILVLDTSFRLTGQLFRGRGDGGFVEDDYFSFEPDLRGERVDVYDVDRDGRLDVVATFLGGHAADAPGGVYLFPGRGDGTFAPGQRWSELFRGVLDFGAPPLVFGDFDRDGQVELVIDDGWGELLWVRGAQDVRVLFSRVGAFTAADLDRDGHLELLVAQPRAYAGDDTTLHVSRSRSEGGLGFAAYTVPTTGVRDIQVADVDGDGELDIALADEQGATIVRRTR